VNLFLVGVVLGVPIGALVGIAIFWLAR